MTKNNHIFYFLIFLILVSGFSSIITINKNRKLTGLIENKNNEEKINQFNYTETIKSLWDNYFYQKNELYINPNKINTSGLGNSIVILISGNHCIDCIEFALKELEKRSDTLNIKITALYDCDNERRLNIFKSLATSIEFQSYKFKDTRLDFYAPIYAFIDNNLRLSLIFTPEKDKPNLTNEYFNRISLL